MNTQVMELIDDLGLHVSGDIISPKEGRIAKNYIVPTTEAGDVLVRIRPLASAKQDAILEYGPSRFEFEAEVIGFLGHKDVPVPKLLNFKSTGTPLFRSEDAYAFCYPTLPGAPIDNEDITSETAYQAGQLMLRFLTQATAYQSKGGEPDGDIAYIERILTAYTKSNPPSIEDAQIKVMFNHLHLDEDRRKLEASPSGICHGDFFFENVIQNNGKISGLIDFGDAYFGNLLMDVTTASMEFSVKPDGVLDKELFDSFLEPIAPWLKANKIDFDLFHYSLLANCVRFVAHTLSLDSAAGNDPQISENPYVVRFFDFSSDALKDDLRASYNRALTDSSSKPSRFPQALL